MAPKKKKSQKLKIIQVEPIQPIRTLADNEFHYTVTEPKTGSRPQPLRVYINLNSLKKKKLMAGDFVLLSNTVSKLSTLSYAWPSLVAEDDLILISNITLKNLQLNDYSILTIEPLEQSPIDADVINLIPQGTYPTDTEFIIYLKEVLIDLEYCMDNQIFNCLNKKEYFYTIKLDTPNQIYKINRETKIRIKNNNQPIFNQYGYDKIGGLDSQLDQIREIVDLSLNQPEKFLRHGLSPPKGLLLNGPAGTGKTLIAKAVASETNAHVIIINGPEVISQFYGETERLLKDYFLEAIENQPSIIFIDEIDSLCPKRDSSNNELEKRVVTCLLTLMDGVDQNTHNRLVVIGATNRIDSIDSALRRPGRFDREFEIGIPNSKQRFDILKKLCAGLNHCLSDEDIEQVASMAHGYVGADLAGVCREGGLYTLKRSRDLNVEDDVLSTDPEFLITKEDLIFGLSKVGPSVIREVVLDVPKVYWDDIGGQSDIKQRLKEAVEWPLKHPEHFRKFNIKPPKGLLLYGPPGCSKTLMAKALATEAGLNFLAVKGPEDEIDSLAVRRSGGETSVADRVLSQLLAEMDGIEPLVNVTIIAATNRPDILDSALLRPGRIDSILYVAPPDISSREAIFKIKFKKMPVEDIVDSLELAKLTKGFSGAETVAVCQQAALLAMEESDVGFVKRKHFIEAIKKTTKRITKEMLEFYHDFETRSGLRSV